MKDGVKIEMRINNHIFECFLEKKMYSASEKVPYGVTGIAGLAPNPQDQGQFLMNLQVVIICEDCYNNNKDDKGLHFKDPTSLVKPTDEMIQKINLKKIERA